MAEAEDLEHPQSDGLMYPAWRYPKTLGKGHCCFIELRDGIDLCITQYQLHDDVIMQLPERSHPLEYTFRMAADGGRSPTSQGNTYSIWGSGLAPAETHRNQATTPTVEINVHLDPALFQEFAGSSSHLASVGLAHLMRPLERPYYQRSAPITPAMQMVAHQLLHCPFQGITQKMYLESKVWELLALIIEQERNLHQTPTSQPALKPDDIERIYLAKEILIQQMSQPPSLLDLARQVGLNDCTLKRGFRQVFGKTAFGYLHDYRLEQARQLLHHCHLNVSEVARTIGFANRSYFAAAFRKKYGISPKHYLTQQKNSV